MAVEMRRSRRAPRRVRQRGVDGLELRQHAADILGGEPLQGRPQAGSDSVGTREAAEPQHLQADREGSDEARSMRGIDAFRHGDQPGVDAMLPGVGRGRPAARRQGAHLAQAELHEPVGPHLLRHGGISTRASAPARQPPTMPSAEL